MIVAKDDNLPRQAGSRSSQRPNALQKFESGLPTDFRKLQKRNRKQRNGPYEGRTPVILLVLCATGSEEQVRRTRPWRVSTKPGGLWLISTTMRRISALH